MTPFSKASSIYHTQSPVQAQMAQELYALLQKNLPNHANVFEFGAGSGHLTHLLLQDDNISQLKVIDLSFPMLFQNQSKSPLHNKQVDYIEANAESYNLPTCFEVYCGNACIQWFKDLDLFLSRCSQTLASGSLLAFSSFTPKHFSELKESFEQSHSSTFPTPIQTYSSSTIQNTTEKYSFSLVEHQTGQHTQQFSSLQQVLRSFKEMGVQNATPQKNLHYKKWVQSYQNLFGEQFPLSWSWDLWVFRKA